MKKYIQFLICSWNHLILRVSCKVNVKLDGVSLTLQKTPSIDVYMWTGFSIGLNGYFCKPWRPDEMSQNVAFQQGLHSLPR